MKKFIFFLYFFLLTACVYPYEKQVPYPQNAKLRQAIADTLPSQLRTNDPRLIQRFLSLGGNIVPEPKHLRLLLPAGATFRPDNAAISALMQAELDILIELMQNHPHTILVIEGYTDSRGSVAHNANLAMYRAQAVKFYLTSQGIAAHRLINAPLATRRVRASNRNPQGRRYNRRVELLLYRSMFRYQMYGYTRH